MTGKTVVSVENISKQYRLGQLGTGTVSHDLNRWWHRIRGKEDPYAKVGDVNDRSRAGGSDYVWSLKDINFEVQQGEVLGIIGKNGAGKSTLLKILSQVTTPSTGQVRVKGRIAALLEVGTGFHPELTGKENIFLNGAILGMTKAEIRSKFDEIVDFSGVAKYVDTPVKRYSSGMLVRLGFAVAAHLEPEILIVDEVLAVGDMEFQKRCLGKMKDVAGEGRTILFVSHNMSAVKTLCKTGIFLKNGCIEATGPIQSVVADYLSENKQIAETGVIPEDFAYPHGNGEARFKKVCLTDASNTPSKDFLFGETLYVSASFYAKKEMRDCTVCFIIGTPDGDNVLFCRDSNFSTNESKIFPAGMNSVNTRIDVKLMPGSYSVTAGIFNTKQGFTIDWLDHIYSFSVSKSGVNGSDDYHYDVVHGYVEPASYWSYK